MPWLDEWELRPGLPWQRVLEQQIVRIKSAAVFVGKNGIGPWQNMELEAYLRQFVRRGCPVIPVILPDCEETPERPLFLEGMTWVDFRKDDPDPMQRLIWGITGERDVPPERAEDLAKVSPKRAKVSPKRAEVSPERAEDLGIEVWEELISNDPARIEAGR